MNAKTGRDSERSAGRTLPGWQLRNHHASGEQQGIYDPGFVIVTREAKKQFLDSSKSIARMAKSPDAAALKGAWDKVAQEFKKLHEGTH